ncbi:MAG: GntR family transcriptional regulator [Kiritimatiellae bacterium]|nr:GntR family transcriptional regulator [Kiritimatiellia bacterium]
MKTLSRIDVRSTPDLVADRIRELIVERKFASDTPLPSTDVMAEQFGVAAGSVHQGLSKLVAEGWLIRKKGHGTFVRQRETKLSRLGLYVASRDILNQHWHVYYQRLYALLNDLAHERGMELEIVVDSRRDEATFEPLPRLVKAVQLREIQAVIVPRTGPRQFAWIAKLPVPVSVCGSVHFPSSVTDNLNQIADLAADYLQRCGCRSAGFISSHVRPPLEPDGALHPVAEYHDRLVASLNAKGLRVKPEWVQTMPQALANNGINHFLFGRNAFEAMWSRQDRPEGLFVDEDIASQGVLMEMEGRVIKVPSELRLVLHKNEGLPYPCRVPAAFIVTSARRAAETLLDMVERQWKGLAVEPVVMNVELEESAEPESGNATVKARKKQRR